MGGPFRRSCLIGGRSARETSVAGSGGRAEGQVRDLRCAMAEKEVIQMYFPTVHSEVTAP
jgi:hypothetical protein